MNVSIKRGDVFSVDLTPVFGSEQGGLRPMLIVQNDVGNKYSPTVIGIPITSKSNKKQLQPTHCPIHSNLLEHNSVLLFEQIRTIDKKRLTKYLFHVDPMQMQTYHAALCVSLGLPASIAITTNTPAHQT